MRNIFIITLFVIGTAISAQTAEQTIKSIFDNALSTNTAEEHLYYLCKNTKGRLPGSPEAIHAVEYTKWALMEAGADSVWLQPVPVPHWIRGEEKAVAYSRMGNINLTISALGLSVGTDENGIEAGIIEVNSFDDLKVFGESNISGKIVFFNRPADVTLINTFASYAGAVDQRVYGASEAAKYGALAVIVRSPTQAKHDFVHTGVLRYSEGNSKNSCSNHITS